jgi:hypothetical protein
VDEYPTQVYKTSTRITAGTKKPPEGGLIYAAISLLSKIAETTWKMP